MKKYILIIFNLMLAPCGHCENIIVDYSDVIRNLRIENNFKGFSYQFDENTHRLQVTALPGSFVDKNLVGMTLVFSEEGKLTEIEPLFIDYNKSFEPTIWALDAFKVGEISIESLWEIIRFSIPDDASDVQVVSFIISTLASSEDFPELSSILLQTNSSFMLVIKNIIDESGTESRIENLEDVKVLLDSR